MRATSASSPAPTTEFREFIVGNACAVCEGSILVRATPSTMRAVCRRCSWISQPLLWEGNGQVAVAYPPMAAA